jgi:hypothetical protein
MEKLTCKTCSKVFVYVRKKGHRRNKCNKCCVDKRRADMIEFALSLKGNCCIICGYDKCKRSLQFHHLDVTKKDFNISENWGASKEKYKNELAKCVLLCANCHGEVHDGLVSLICH